MKENEREREREREREYIESRNVNGHIYVFHRWIGLCFGYSMLRTTFSHLTVGI